MTSTVLEHLGLKFNSQNENKVTIPPMTPKLKYMNQMLGANMLRMKPQEATIDPAMVTARHPYLFVSALAIGPGRVKNIKLLWQ